MLSLDAIRASLKDRRIPIISDATGLSYNTITNIRDGEQTNPNYSTLRALSDYLEPPVAAAEG